MQDLLIDTTRLVHRVLSKRLPTGVDRVSLAYIRHYRPYARAVVRHHGGKFVFRRYDSEKIFDWLLSLGKSGYLKPLIYKGLISGCLAQRVAGSFLINTGHSGLESDDYVEMLQEQCVRPIFMVHDLIPISHPSYCRAGEQTRHISRLKNAMKIASGIICNSQATMNALFEACREHQWDMPPTVVALLASDLPIVSAEDRPIVQPYFVFVSTVEPRKNHLMILRVWQQLAARLGSDTPKLIIIGQRGWLFSELTELLHESRILRALVTEISDCCDQQLVNYLRHAQALLFPSFVEGYGMPVLEALALGVPVIASDLPVFREFAMNVPEYVGANDSDAWMDMISEYSNSNSSRRQAQLTRMNGFRAPTWENHFSRVDTLLSELNHATSHI